MQAKEWQLERVLEGRKQFLVPHYQRPYKWTETEWRTLWQDVGDLVDDPSGQPHFLGPIVTAPARSVPEGVEKRLLIDGQQRLTTLVLLLALVRDRAREVGVAKVPDRIQDILTNRNEDGDEVFKLLPTQGTDVGLGDRQVLTSIVRGESFMQGSLLGRAHGFFRGKLQQFDAPAVEVLQRILFGKLVLVSIVLDDHDNPHRIFESLNGKGRPLSQADLIRNYFFMRLDPREHESTYRDLWRPMQERLGEENLTSFVRHALMKEGPIVRESDVYAALKTKIDTDRSGGPLEHLRALDRVSRFYRILLSPQHESNAQIRNRLVRLNRLEVTVAYPFLLGVWDDRERGILRDEDVTALLDTLENYLVRRWVCGVPTYGLNKIFAPLYGQAWTRALELSSTQPDFVDAVRRVLASKGYPRDEDFRRLLEEAKLYGSGDRRDKTKFLLERLEASFQHKETVAMEDLTIEHVMPQTLRDEWKDELGPMWEDAYEQLLHTLGNLTITKYNGELQNDSFLKKKAIFATSHVELNKYFASVDRWTADEMERRAEVLSERALAMWPHFGPVQPSQAAASKDGVTGRVPQAVAIRGQSMSVRSWADVAKITVDAIVALGDEEFDRVAAELPKFVNRNATAFRRSSKLRQLANGAYVETNLSAQAVYRWCVQGVQLAGLGPDEWQVMLVPAGETQAAALDDDDQGGGADEVKGVRQLQLDFWKMARTALAATGKFPSLRQPGLRHWFDVALGRRDAWMSLSANTRDAQLGVKVILAGDMADEILENLVPYREEIEREIGASLQWNARPESRRKQVRLVRPGNIRDRANWPEILDWLVRMAVAFQESFAPRLAALDRGGGSGPGAS